ncbi:MAG: glycosyltransferase, partial [Thermoplasmata archaeon]|nr:glycosyltransferase [Thermoplasmata archaeon]
MSSDKKKKTIALAMILKNEAETVEKAIESVVGFIDEIVVGIDENTSDNTEEIVRKYTDKIHRFRWQNDFSKARNEILKHCTSDWVLQLDGHEVLRESSREGLVKVLETLTDDIDAVAFRLKMQDEDHNFSGLQLRLFRNDSEIRYTGAVHNIIDCEHSRTVGFSNI